MDSKGSNLWMLTTLLLIGIVVGLVVNAVSSDNTNTNEAANVIAPTSGQGNSPVYVGDISVDDETGLGDPNAPIVMIEFSDYQCPYCRRAYNDLLPQLKENYIDTGLVYFVYRDFPLTSIHDDALKAAEATECADEQGAFWGMHDAIFEGQGPASNGTVSIPEETLKQYAADLGLDTEQFNTCLDSGQYEQEVLSDVADGRDYGVTGTPAFFINGYLFPGAQPYETISAIIDEMLAEQQL